MSESVAKLGLSLDFLSSPDDVIEQLGLEEIVREATTEATALILNRIRTRFLAQEDSQGVAWEPSFAAFERSFNGRGGGTGYDTGTLFNSIQQYSISPSEQSIATDVYYGKYFQDGTKNEDGSERTPPREFLAFNAEDEDLAVRVLLSKISEAFS